MHSSPHTVRAVHTPLPVTNCMRSRSVQTREGQEWFFTFPLPPIPMQSIPIPSHSHSQFCHQFPFPWESHGIPIPIGNPIPMVISSTDCCCIQSLARHLVALYSRGYKYTPSSNKRHLFLLSVNQSHNNDFKLLASVALFKYFELASFQLRLLKSSFKFIVIWLSYGREKGCFLFEHCVHDMTAIRAVNLLLFLLAFNRDGSRWRLQLINYLWTGRIDR